MRTAKSSVFPIRTGAVDAVSIKRKGSTAASMPYQASFIVQSGAIFIAELYGTIGESRRCVTRMEHGQECCNAPTVQETDLQNAVVNTINLALGNKDSVIEKLRQNIETAINQEDDTSAKNIDIKLECLQKELLERAKAKKDYNEIADEIFRLRELKQNALVENAEREALKQRIANF